MPFDLKNTLSEFQRVKWWSKFDEQTKLTDTLIKNWLSSKGFLQPTLTGSKAQQTFLTQKEIESKDRCAFDGNQL